jgi:hypothetical protein
MRGPSASAGQAWCSSAQASVPASSVDQGRRQRACAAGCSSTIKASVPRPSTSAPGAACCRTPVCSGVPGSRPASSRQLAHQDQQGHAVHEAGQHRPRHQPRQTRQARQRQQHLQQARQRHRHGAGRHHQWQAVRRLRGQQRV